MMNPRLERTTRPAVRHTEAVPTAVRRADVAAPRLVPVLDADRVSSRASTQDVELLEREPVLTELDALLEDAAGGRGRIATISGEAGIGKTSLVEHFLASHSDASTLRGLCDPLSTPRPLGPVYDMAKQTNGPLAVALGKPGSREQLFSAFLSELDLPPAPCIVVIEDAHWVDDATLDLLKFVGRRIRELPTLLVITYRDDEVGPNHQLYRLLGELPRDAVRRLRLPLLSEAAVGLMARRTGRTAEGVHALTGGNPFFVTEILASSTASVPASIREAVFARAARLSAEARSLLDLVAAVPGKMERTLIEKLLVDTPRLTRECADSGILIAGPDTLGFRHELARMAWQEEVDPGTAASLHSSILKALLENDRAEFELARIVHHADGAADSEHVLHFAPPAAREAAAVGAHGQAAAHYATALRYAGALAPAERAALLEGFSYEQHLGGRIDDAVAARKEALALRRSINDLCGEGANLLWLSRLAWLEGRVADSVAFAEEAIAILEPLGSTSELAMAYSNIAWLSFLTDDSAGTTIWSERAIALGKQIDHIDSVVYGLTALGSQDVLLSRENVGSERLQQAIDLALEHNLHERATRVYAMRGTIDTMRRDYALARTGIEQALRFAADHDLYTWERYLLGWRARLEFEIGDWEAAERDAVAVLGQPNTPDVARCHPLVVQGLLRARRGESEGDALVDEAVSLAHATSGLERIGPAVAARAEVAWLRDDLDAVRADLKAALEVTRNSYRHWDRARLVWWLWRSGDLTVAPDGTPDAVRLQVEGDWRGAAEAWERIGAPYDRALALAAGDTPDAWHEALVTLEALGAHDAAAAVRRDLRRRGVRGFPRGPRRATRKHPAGLTPAQVRVLEQLARGLSNVDIARELFLSSRTVDHHVSAILAKLDVPTRSAAIAAVHDRELLRPI
jgi:DNA-binding CsgD family transcriptional regulator/tetratricopeptide (TPR) repeat protein